jgi:hypothetical protein
MLAAVWTFEYDWWIAGPPSARRDDASENVARRGPDWTASLWHQMETRSVSEERRYGYSPRSGVGLPFSLFSRQSAFSKQAGNVHNPACSLGQEANSCKS